MPCLSQRTLRRILTLATLTLLSATLALAQESAQPGNRDFAKSGTDNWSYAAIIGLPQKKLFVVTLAHPTQRHACRVQSSTNDQLACKDGLGVRHTYQARDIAALIVPGDYGYKLRFVLGANTALGAAIWGTVVLAPVCPPCAVATGIAAFFIFGAAGAVLIGDDQPDSLLYLAPGQTLQVKLRD